MHSRGVCGNNAVQFQSCDISSYYTVLGENGCTNTASCQLREIPVWSNDGAGNSLKAEPMCKLKTIEADHPW